MTFAENASILTGLISVVRGGALIFTLVCSLARPLGAASFQTLASLPGSSDGADPLASLVDVSGSLYGITYSGGKYFSGTVFRLDPRNGHTETVYGFTGHGDGAGPTSLTSDEHVIYGATAVESNFGGPQGYGTVFGIDPATGSEVTLHSFSGGVDGSSSNKLVMLNGKLYGSTWDGGTQNSGVIFTIDPVSGVKTIVHTFGLANDDAHPIGDLFASDGQLYGSTSDGGPTYCGILFRLDVATGMEHVISSFPNTCGSPRGNGIVRVDNTFYGVNGGGANGKGAVFKVDGSIGEDQILYSFNGGQDGNDPTGGLVLSGGLLYGTTELVVVEGGSNVSRETIFTVDPSSGAFNTAFTFPNAGGINAYGDFTAAALLDDNGILYGTCIEGGIANGGTAFSFTPATGSFVDLHNFVSPNYNGNSGLIVSRGQLYGTSQQGSKAGLGSVFRVNPQTGAVRSIHDFTGGSDGYTPTVTSLFVKGRSLLGATAGDNALTPHGTVFSLDTATDTLTTLNDFSGDPTPQDGPNSGVAELNGALYGTTDLASGGNAGSVYRIPRSPSDSIKMTSLQSVGGDSIGGLTSYQGALYGTTFAIYGVGQVFKFDPKTFALSTVYAFRGGDDGELPYAGVIEAGGKLYGTTLFGGSASAGTVFQVDPTTGAESILHTFLGGADGYDAASGLLAVGSTLYGTTGGGGANSNGTIFSINIATGAYAILYSFSGGADGGFPSGSLALFGSSFYGTTSLGGTSNRGTVFRFTP